MTKGIPRFTVRLHGAVIEALKQLAAARQTTPSEILRDLVIDELKNNGYPIEAKGEGTNA